MTTAQPIQFHAPDAPEDRARADLYALIATLFYAPPDAGLLQALAEADEIVGEDDSVALAEAWGALQRACAAVDDGFVGGGHHRGRGPYARLLRRRAAVFRNAPFRP